jgi:hypothetical protein
MADTLEAIYMFAAANKNLKFTSQVIKPLKVSSIGVHTCKESEQLLDSFMR